MVSLAAAAGSKIIYNIMKYGMASWRWHQLNTFFFFPRHLFCWNVWVA
jgi:hypothetical protein